MKLYKLLLTNLFCLFVSCTLLAQDTVQVHHPADSIALHQDSLAAHKLRIINMNPYFTLHVDSVLQYRFEINKPQDKYYWYLKNAPVGLKLDKSSGNLYFKAEKSFFKSGKLKYDVEYKVLMGVQSLQDQDEKVDTFCTIVFYNTDIVPSKLKPTINGTLAIEEGDSVKFRVQCDDGSFPIEQISMLTNIPITQYSQVKKCDDEFAWMVPFDFIKDNDTAKQKTLTLSFVGTDKFFNRDTAQVKLVIRPGINYPLQNSLHKRISAEVADYVATLKLTFYVLSSTVKRNKGTRIGFDVSGSTTALAGTVLATSGTTETAKDLGKILPSIGLTLVPVKEAVAPNKIQEQNTATQLRTVAKRLEYLNSENQLSGDRDVDVLAKTKKLQDELKQARLQLVDLPLVEFDADVSQEDAEKYFKDPKVNKKYKMKVH
ncbi:MAG TPA: hypothetical protein VLC98_02450 [Phnomibacter sp.]|nr:hypothetical protein [Phnomibacter sp.]